MKPWKHYEVIQKRIIKCNKGEDAFDVTLTTGRYTTGKTRTWGGHYTSIEWNGMNIIKEHGSSLYICFLEAANTFRSQGYDLNVYGLHQAFRLTTVASGTMPHIPHRVSIIDPVEED